MGVIVLSWSQGLRQLEMISPLTITVLLGFLSLFGLLASVYFSTLYFKRFREKIIQKPIAQQQGKGSCEIVISSSFAQTFGVPNFCFGTVFYALILAVSIIRVLTGEFFILRETAFAAGLALLFSVYLFFALFMRLKIW